MKESLQNMFFVLNRISLLFADRQYTILPYMINNPIVSEPLNKSDCHIKRQEGSKIMFVSRIGPTKLFPLKGQSIETLAKEH